MTLLETIYTIGSLAMDRNLVNSYYAGNTIFYTNGDTVRAYPYVFVSPASDHTVENGTITYGLVVYYVDRLLEDDRNECEVMSVAIDTLLNLAKQLREEAGVLHVYVDRIRNFTEVEKFADRCGGAYMYLRVETQLPTNCGEDIL